MLKGYTKEEFHRLAKVNGITINEIAEACDRTRSSIHMAFNIGSDTNQLFYSLVLDRLIEEKKKKGKKVYKIVEG